MEAINVRDLLSNVHDFGLWCAEDTNTAIQFQPLPLDLPIYGKSDLNWLRDNLYCVMGNAIKYSLPTSDGVLITIEYNLGSQEPYVSTLKFSFQDCGEYLSTKAMESFFERPIQRNRIKMGGMGQGVYCLKQRVLALGGTCDIERRVGNIPGTIVWFSIPFKAIINDDSSIDMIELPNSSTISAAHEIINEDGKDHNTLHLNLEFNTQFGTNVLMSEPTVNDDRTIQYQNSTVEVNRKYSSSFRRLSNTTTVVPINVDKISVLSELRILVVDDSVPILKMMVKVLKLENAIVTESKNGQDALDKFIGVEGNFDIVVTDIQVSGNIFKNVISES